MRLARLEELQAEKAALAQSYELELRRLRAEPARLGGLEPAERALLEASMRDFQRTARLNTERLLQARQVAEGVARVLRDSVAGSAPARKSTTRMKRVPRRMPPRGLSCPAGQLRSPKREAHARRIMCLPWGFRFSEFVMVNKPCANNWAGWWKVPTTKNLAVGPLK